MNRGSALIQSGEGVKREAVELVPLNFDSLLITIGNLFPMRKSWVLFLPHDLG